MSGSSDFTTTPNLGLYKPNFDVDIDQWGYHWNANADTLDAALAADGTAPFVRRAGDTMTGKLAITMPSADMGAQFFRYGYGSTVPLMQVQCAGSDSTTTDYRALLVDAETTHDDGPGGAMGILSVPIQVNGRSYCDLYAIHALNYVTNLASSKTPYPVGDGSSQHGGIVTQTVKMPPSGGYPAGTIGPDVFTHWWQNVVNTNVGTAHGGADVLLEADIVANGPDDIWKIDPNHRTGNTTAGNATITGLGDTTPFSVGQTINIAQAGDTYVMARIVSLTGTTITIDTPTPQTVTGAIIAVQGGIRFSFQNTMNVSTTAANGGKHLEWMWGHYQNGTYSGNGFSTFGVGFAFYAAYYVAAADFSQGVGQTASPYSADGINRAVAIKLRAGQKVAFDGDGYRGTWLTGVAGGGLQLVKDTTTIASFDAAGGLTSNGILKTTVNLGATPAVGQGALIAWNYTQAQGEVDFFNLFTGGGFSWYQMSAGGAASRVMNVDAAGNLTLAGTGVRYNVPSGGNTIAFAWTANGLELYVDGNDEGALLQNGTSQAVTFNNSVTARSPYGGWSSANFGNQLLITCPANYNVPALGFTDAGGTNDSAITGGTAFNFYGMPPRGNSTTPPVNWATINASGLTTEGGTFSAPVSITDNAGASYYTLAVNAPNSGIGPNIALTGPGTTTPRKFIGVGGAGQLHIMNDATQYILTLDDAGDLAVVGQLSTTHTGGGGSAGILVSSASVPAFAINDSAQAADAKIWDFISQGSTLEFRAVNDANSAASNWLAVTRTGYVPQAISLTAPTINLAGTAVAGASVHAYGNTASWSSSNFGSQILVMATANNPAIGLGDVGGANWMAIAGGTSFSVFKMPAPTDGSTPPVQYLQVGPTTINCGLPLVCGAFSTAGPGAAKGGTSYTVAAGDASLLLTPTGTFTLTLPTAAAPNVGRMIRLKLTAAFAVNSASANVVPLAGGSASTAIMTATAGKFCLLQSDGTNWQIMEAN